MTKIKKNIGINDIVNIAERESERPQLADLLHERPHQLGPDGA
jgi:hypothetical protein